jgi:ATP phosphoribosyltransferase
MLTIAIAKGRLTEQFGDYLQQKGQQTWAKALHTAGRELVVETDGARFLLVKGPDVPTYVERGIAPIGIVGEDILLEERPDVYNVHPFPFGKCYFAIATRKERDPSKPLRVIATKYPNVTKRYFATLQQEVECIPLQGSVELAAVMGLADGIVDIVETGQTLRANGLEERQFIRSLQARCIVNKHAYFTQQAEIKRLLETWRFEEVRSG